MIPHLTNVIGSNRGTIQKLTLQLHHYHAAHLNIPLRDPPFSGLCPSWQAILDVIMTKDQVRKLSSLNFVIKNDRRSPFLPLPITYLDFETGPDYFDEVITYALQEYLDPLKVSIEIDNIIFDHLPFLQTFEEVAGYREWGALLKAPNQ